ncbi:DUF6090 family protein [Croceitalea rosinachiae]|uniref:DUF6090 family protein n=1 Tax=Croceitalea rosinachiae TaxID=3075596 RepID=A0ABU3A755_9FLAO|nr:DUF6090 family protein [Croceitalea sp. F388]MDT0605992.1 DUF6090 family protein [Croceitalea sp. F388]
MIKLFRRIRQKLLSENKFSKYLLYAIGEIILVVIGILIALQINNWNEDLNIENQREKLIAALHSDALTTDNRLDFGLQMASDINQKLSHFLKILSRDNTTISRDTLKIYSSYIFQVANFKPAMSSYETAVSTGNIALLENETLLSQYIQFKDDYDWFKLHQDISGNMVYLGSVWEFRKKLGSTNLIMKNMGVYPKDFELNDTDFRAVFKEKETYATFESMQWLVRNQWEALNRAQMANKAIMETLTSMQNQ